MKEILWLGRGGQGAFTAARLLGAAFSAKESGNSALAFPSFGPERRGAPVRAFTKLDTREISDRSETEKADYIVVLDETLYSDSLTDLLKPDGKIIVNSGKPGEDRIITSDAESLASELRLPTVNTVMLGILSAVSGVVSEEDIFRAVEGYMPEKIREKNKLAVHRAYGEAL